MLKDFMIQISFHSSQWIWRRFSKISNFQPTRKFGVHLEWQVRSPNLILEEDHRRSITTDDKGQGMTKAHFGSGELIM